MRDLDIETEKRMGAARDWGKEKWRVRVQRGQTFNLGRRKSSGDGCGQSYATMYTCLMPSNCVLHNSGNEILHYVYFTTLKKSIIMGYLGGPVS